MSLRILVIPWRLTARDERSDEMKSIKGIPRQYRCQLCGRKGASGFTYSIRLGAHTCKASRACSLRQAAK
jgi:hypothetical protein